MHCRWAYVDYNCSEFFSYINAEGGCCVFNKIPSALFNADMDK